MNKTISLILMLLVGIGVNVNATAADNTVKTSFATVTLPDGWYLVTTPKKESKCQATYNGVVINQLSSTLRGPAHAGIEISRYDTGKTANIDGVKAFLERLQQSNPERLSNLKWEYDKTKNMWIGIDEKVTSSYDHPDTKTAYKDVIYLQQNGKYIDIFCAYLSKSAVNDPKIAKQIDAIFKSWTPKPVKK